MRTQAKRVKKKGLDYFENRVFKTELTLLGCNTCSLASTFASLWNLEIGQWGITCILVHCRYHQLAGLPDFCLREHSPLICIKLCAQKHPLSKSMFSIVLSFLSTRHCSERSLQKVPFSRFNQISDNPTVPSLSRVFPHHTRILDSQAQQSVARSPKGGRLTTIQKANRIVPIKQQRVVLKQ